MDKVYKFSYGGTFRKILCKIIHFFYCACVGMLILYFLAFLFSELNYSVKDIFSEKVINVMTAIEIYFSLVVFIASLIPSFIPQKVIINDYEVKIRRNMIMLSIYLLRGFNDNIMLCEIESVSKANLKLYDLRFTPLPSATFVLKDIVKIKTENKYYYVSVENSDEFVEELINRVNDYKRKHNMEEIK